jgi:hypothetical protein
MKVYLACKPVDMRRDFDGLAADVAQTLRADPYLYVGRDYVAAASREALLRGSDLSYRHIILSYRHIIM